MKLIIQWGYDTIKIDIIPEKSENFCQMIYTSFHTHSKYCDGSKAPEEYVLKALELGFKALGFSSHAPLPFENDWTLKDRDLNSYLDDIDELKSRYKDKIEIYKGLEIDYIRGLMSPADRKYAALNLDFSIGSVHVQRDEKTGEYPGIDYTDHDMDQLLKNTFSGDIKRLIRSYYKDLRDMINRGGFTFLGHLDVVKKTNKGSKYFNENSRWYREEVKNTLICAKEKGVIMEVNTGNSRWESEDSIFPSPWILQQAKQMEIPVILNSDAHRPDRIDAHFLEALKVLKEAGYRETVYLKRGKIISQKIG